MREITVAFCFADASRKKYSIKAKLTEAAWRGRHSKLNCSCLQRQYASVHKQKRAHVANVSICASLSRLAVSLLRFAVLMQMLFVYTTDVQHAPDTTQPSSQW